MKRRIVLAVVCISFLVFSAAGLAENADDKEGEKGRYQIYATEKITLLLDTVTGKAWKINIDQLGKAKAEGITVEGLAYSVSDIETLNRKISELNFEGFTPEQKDKCKKELSATFSYALDRDKVNEIFKNCR